MPAAPSPQERPATADCRPTAPRRNRQAWASALAAALFATSAACFFFGMQAQHAVQDAACALTLTGAHETAGRLLAFAAWVFLLPFPTALSCCAAGLLRRASRDGRMPDDAQGRTVNFERTRGRLRLGRLRRPCRHGDVLRKLGSLRGLLPHALVGRNRMGRGGRGGGVRLVAAVPHQGSLRHVRPVRAAGSNLPVRPGLACGPRRVGRDVLVGT